MLKGKIRTNVKDKYNGMIAVLKLKLYSPSQCIRILSQDPNW